MRAYYNEREPFAADWLRNLIAAGLIAPGDVDSRDIRDVRPGDLDGYGQCHFFAGIGGWSLALRLAGWPDDQPVWTGSCPCQPFSAAGRGGGFADERHLWPHWHWLIEQCRPATILGEQVASKDGLGWFDLVSADLEGTGYAVGAADLCAAGVGAPHPRQRLYFVGRRSGAYSNRSDKHWRDCPLQMGRQPYESAASPVSDALRNQWRSEPRPAAVAHGVPGRVGQCCAYGNAIVPQVAAQFIRATGLVL